MSSTDVVAISELSEAEIDAVSGGFRLILGSPNVNISTQTNLAVLNFWSCPHQTGHAAWVADCEAMNSRGERMRKPL